MSAPVVVLAAVLGLVVGSFLNVVVRRVPAGESLLAPSHCPACEAPVRAWQNVPVVSWVLLRGRCASCRTPIGLRYPLVEAGTAAAFAAVAARDPGDAGQAAHAILTVTLCGFAAVSVALALIDLDTHRLPDAIVGPSYLAALALLTAASAVSGDWAALGRGVAGLAVMLAGYYALHWLRPDGMGFGDVKLAGLLGLLTAYLGWGALAAGALAAFLLAGCYAVVLVATRRAGRRSGIPFGPWMLLGAWVGIAAGAQLAAGYLEVSGLS